MIEIPLYYILHLCGLIVIERIFLIAHIFNALVSLAFSCTFFYDNGSM